MRVWGSPSPIFRLLRWHKLDRFQPGGRRRIEDHERIQFRWWLKRSQTRSCDGLYPRHPSCCLFVVGVLPRRLRFSAEEGPQKSCKTRDKQIVQQCPNWMLHTKRASLSQGSVGD